MASAIPLATLRLQSCRNSDARERNERAQQAERTYNPARVQYTNRWQNTVLLATRPGNRECELARKDTLAYVTQCKMDNMGLKNISE